MKKVNAYKSPAGNLMIAQIDGKHSLFSAFLTVELGTTEFVEIVLGLTDKPDPTSFNAYAIVRSDGIVYVYEDYEPIEEVEKMEWVDFVQVVNDWRTLMAI
jgi:Ethanolamine utilization protein EutJ (predicted chaperonin)